MTVLVSFFQLCANIAGNQGTTMNRTGEPSIVQPIAALGQLLAAAAHSIQRDKGENVLPAGTVERATAGNGWFTRTELERAFRQWANALKPDAVRNWTQDIAETRRVYRVGVIAAGNIPLVGLHDALAVLVSGHHLVFKPASGDRVLMETVLQFLAAQSDDLAARITIAEDKLGKVDVVIATGTNNTARYFDYYFRDIPKIIRKNRTSVAILTGDESVEEMHALGHDMLDYFGLGCRNVSKLLVPEGYDIQKVIGGVVEHGKVIDHHKYCNNYDYNRALFLMDRVPFLDNNFLLFREEQALFSPLSVIHWHRYGSEEDADEYLKTHENEIQVVVGHGHLPFGQTQLPGLDDYADNVNTLDFLRFNTLTQNMQ